MKVVALVGQKGGSGKTTIAENLAVAAVKHKKTAVLIDLDSQPTAAGWGDRRLEMQKTQEPVVVSAQVARLKMVLEKAKKEGADFVVIDTPPRMADATMDAARVADLVLVPIRPLINDVETLTALKSLLKMTGEKKAVVVINQAPVQGQRAEEAASVAKEQGFEVSPVVLHQRTAFGDAPLSGLAAAEVDPEGKAASECEALYKYVLKMLNERK